MSTTNVEVIDLLEDSSSDSEKETSRPVAKARRGSTVNESIDLCDSSSDDEEDDENIPQPTKAHPSFSNTKKQQARPQESSGPRVARKPSSQASILLDSDDSDDDDELLKGGPVFGSSRKPGANVNRGSSSAQSVSSKPRAYASAPSAGQSQKRPASASLAATTTSSTSTSRKALHNPYASATTTASKASVASASRNWDQRKTPSTHPKPSTASRFSYDVDDDDDDDDLLNVGSGLNLKKPASQPSAAKSTASLPSSSQSSTKVRANPYQPSSQQQPAASLVDRATRLEQETEKAKAMKIRHLRKALNEMGVPCETFVEKSEFVEAYAKGVVDREFATTNGATGHSGDAKRAAPSNNGQQRSGGNDTTEFVYPRLLRTSKQYEDLRAKIAVAYWKFARSLVTQSHQRKKLDQTITRVVDLALADFPVRSLEQFVDFGKTSVNSSGKTLDDVREELVKGGFDRIETPITEAISGRRYYTITEACLVALLSHVERMAVDIKCVDRDMFHQISDDARARYLESEDLWMELEDLIPAVDQLLLPQCPSRLTRPHTADNGASHYLEQSTRSAEFLQIAKLESNRGDDGPLIKRHRRKGRVLYELLPVGFHAAVTMRTRRFPEPKGHSRCSQIATWSQVRPEFRGICLAVDVREGGGGSKVLHKMCSQLDMKRVPYFVGSLQIGDYCFFTTKDGGKTPGPLDFLCPIIVERKSVQDLAMSIRDGRWVTQKHRMYVGQYIFGYDNCRMVYIIEGNKHAQTVTGNFVGARRDGVNIEKLDEEIKNLEDEGFEVMHTPSQENTMFQLARWAKRVLVEMQSGALKPQYTYEEFKTKCDEVRDVNFSYMAKNHTRTKRAAEAAKRAAEEQAAAPSPDVASAAAKKKKKESSSAEEKPSKRQKMFVDKYVGFSKKQLEDECAAVGLKKSGNRSELVARLLGPHPPKVWLRRKRRGEYVPSTYDTGATAILVALYLHERNVGADNAGMTKDELYDAAEELNISKNPFSGGTTQRGPYHYDGWSSMSSLTSGDPALVVLKKKKYKLTRSCDIAGWALAKAMHTWCHEHEHCPCGEP